MAENYRGRVTPNLNDAEIGKILGMSAAGLSAPPIATQLGRSKSAVQRALQRYDIWE